MSGSFLQLRLPPRPESVSCARRAVRAFADLVDSELLERLELLVSELVTNSVRHARLNPRDRVTIEVSERETGVRVAVTDPGVGFDLWDELSRPTRTFEPGGFGLQILAQLADRYGGRREEGMSVWFDADHRTSNVHSGGDRWTDASAFGEGW